jgi:hypothetical protein
MMLRAAIVFVAMLVAAPVGEAPAGVSTVPHKTVIAAVAHARYIHGERVQFVTDILPCANCVQ